MTFVYFIAFAAAFFISLVATIWVAKFARGQQIVDVPDSERHLHKKSTPMLGGLAIFGSFFIVTLVVGLIFGKLLPGNIPLPVLFGIWLGGGVLMIGGYLDDRFRLPAKFSVLFPILATIIILVSGVRAVSVHNPFSSAVILVDQVHYFGLPILSALIVFVWTMTITYTTKLLDGMDGLVTGISAIGALVLFGLSLSPQVMQAQTALLAITFAGSLLGFLILNFYPAKIFLGEGGSTFAGFMLAILAIVSGGKIATTLLVMGIPLLDMVWVIFQRLRHRQSLFSGDRKHLHFKLLEIGLSQPQAVLFLYALTAIFGAAGIFLQSRGKLIAFLILIVVMLAILSALYSLYKNRQKNNE